MATCFISYSSRNKNRAIKLAKALKENDIQVWFSEWDILVGYSLEDQIYEGIKSADFLLIILTKASINSKWVKIELDYARILEIEKKEIRIIPLLFDKIEIPESLKTKVYADFTSSFNKGIENVFKAIKHEIKYKKNNLKAKISIKEIIAPLTIARRLRLVLFQAYKVIDPEIKLEKDKLNINDFTAKLDLLTNFAKSYDVPDICWEWLNWFKDSANSGDLNKLITAKNLSDKRLGLKKWFCGIPLFLGGIMQKLPLISKVALEIGAMIHKVKGRKNPVNDLKYICNILYESFDFSQNFYELMKENISEDKIYFALTHELLHYSDYNKILKFYLGTMNLKAILSGFSLTYLPNPYSENFLDKNEMIAEFLVSHFNAIYEADKIINVTYDVTYSEEAQLIKEKNKNKTGFTELDSKVFSTYMDIWPRLIEIYNNTKYSNESTDWFYFSLRLGQFFDSKEMGFYIKNGDSFDAINIQLINELESICSRIIKDSDLNKKIKIFMHDVYYRKYNDQFIEDRYLSLVANIQWYAFESNISELLKLWFKLEFLKQSK